MRRHVFRAFVAVAFLALSAVGYSYTTFARWTTVPVTFFVNPANLDVTPAAALTALQWGMDQWTNAGSAFSFEYGGPASDTAITLDGRNVVFFRNDSSGSAIATTYSWWDGDENLVDSDIVFWDAPFTFFTGVSGCGGGVNGAYIEDIATHEFGHALGLGHTNVSGATMFPSYNLCSQQFRTLAQDDLNGVRALYPATANTPPTVTITSPANGASFEQGTVISFTATAADTQDGNLTAQIQWTDNGTSIGSGGSLSLAMSTLGPHVIVARVTDSGGLQTTAQVSITITAANTPPTVTITSPANGASFEQSTVITFTATAADTQDGNLTAQIQWTDNGTPIGSGGSLSLALTTLGPHVIAARVTDSGGLQTTAQVTITITAPNGAATLTATGAVVAGLGGGGLHRVTLNWSGLAGATVDVFRNGVRVSTVANNGARFDYPGTSAPITVTYTYKVCSAGTATCTNTVSVSFGTGNTAPTVNISSPANGASFVQGTTISLTATASDTQDGTLTGQIQWTDNGTPVGSGGTVSRTLTTLGAHVIVATVTDTGGLPGSSQVSVTVTAPSGTGTLTATPSVLAGLGGGGLHRVTLNWSGLAGATVDVYRNGVRVATPTNTGTRVDYPGSSAPTSVTYTYKVCSAGTDTCTNTVSVSF